ncbi:MAG TPA: aminoacetone oxidase family FAD-binding enzyme, partial [Treponemataceae bacterium]|nr:aminoacetone oxidase family FAD-binding enzyme [Treponemataceae bacterium]
MTYDLIVAGAGPAGLFCAIQAAAGGLSVCVLEKNANAGKKLLISGSGRCNLTNMAAIGDFPARYGPASRFVAPALRNFTNLDLIEYFAGLGVPLVEMNDGKVFPKSQKARDILEALLADAKRHGVEFVYGCPIAGVDADAGTFRARVDAPPAGNEPPAREFLSKNILLATGGKSYPVTGSAGCGHRIAKPHGHTIIETAPALAPLIVDGYRFADCAGISVSAATIRVMRAGKSVHAARGDILFTHKGLSGPGILDASRY